MISSGRRAEAMWIADGAPRWNILRAPTMSPPLSTQRQRRLPILAGATRDARVLACLGALIGIGLTGLVSAIAAGRGANIPFIVGPIGASAILLFAVPASPLAQPWNIIGGNTISAVVGVIVSRLIHDPMLAAPLAVALAIGAMSLTRSLHPPGGATALTAVVGGAATASAGFMFPLIPVALNCFVLVGVGWVFHRISGQAYPHAPATGSATPLAMVDPAAPAQVNFRSEDVDAALEDLGETFDISRDDLDRLLGRVELRALERQRRSSIPRGMEHAILGDPADAPSAATAPSASG